jgi:hypothetical protein
MVDWTLGTDAYNRTYLYCPLTRSTMWYVNDGVMFWADDFEGKRSSLLYRFYLTVYRLSLVRDAGTVQDQLPLVHFSRPLLRSIQDVFAPFWMFYRVDYQSAWLAAPSGALTEALRIQTSVASKVGGRTVRQLDFELEIQEGALNRWLQVPSKGSDSSPIIYRCSLS